MKFKFFIINLFIYVTSIVAQNNVNYHELFNDYQEKCYDFYKNNQLDSTANYLKKIDVLLIKLKDSSYYYKAELIKGSYLTTKGDYELAMKKLLKATHFFEFQKDSTNYYFGKYRIGVCYYYVNRREVAKEIMNDVLDHSKFITKQMKSNLLSNIGALNIELGMLNKDNDLIRKSILYLKKAINLNLKNKKYDFLPSNYSLLAEAHIQLNNKKNAIKLLDSALYYSKKSDNINNEAFALIKKANILTLQKKYHQALILINKAIRIYQKGDHIPTRIYAFVEKKKLLVAMKSYKYANQIADSIYGLSIKNYDKRFVDGISEMKVKYKTAEKEREILVQRADIAEKGLLIQKQNFQIYGIIGLGVLLTFLAYLIYNQQKLKNKQLIKENKLKVALREIETQNKLQEQRLRISRDLHDNIGAQLSFIISSIDNLKFLTKESNPNLKDKLVYISTFTTTTIHQLRDTIWAMNKNEITITDLQSRILSFIETAKKANNKIVFQLEMEVKSDIIFTSIKGINIFRVVQEAINNALKYADANLIKVKIEELKNKLELSVVDDGKGFDFKTVELGNGLKNMQDRIDEIEGELIINSSEKGTTINVTCYKDTTNII